MTPARRTGGASVEVETLEKDVDHLLENARTRVRDREAKEGRSV